MKAGLAKGINLLYIERVLISIHYLVVVNGEMAANGVASG